LLHKEQDYGTSFNPFSIKLIISYKRKGKRKLYHVIGSASYFFDQELGFHGGGEEPSEMEVVAELGRVWAAGAPPPRRPVNYCQRRPPIKIRIQRGILIDDRKGAQGSGSAVARW
jgi:hypothetical protein